MRRLLLVEVALPEEPSEAIGAQLIRALGAAVEEAERWADRQWRVGELTELHRIVQALEEGPLAGDVDRAIQGTGRQ
jgi:hypothetical protein